ncbi:hypothetical protein Y032_0066g3732 [Ancylostoma ceylanicum]|uniref:glucuronosyltransferase n=1 Tax=Ancylostoma ceylanicum TaxID=53326 RepID=A0A016U027_9BILA|nr:hypothetical protein Y032_0066g3732 [Ancylostoma ceylanicum]
MLLPLLFILFVNFCESYKILVVNPKMGYSHMNFLGQVADTLVDAGHEVVTLQPLIFPHVNNGTSKSRLIQVGAYMHMSKEMQAEHDEKHKMIWTASATNPIGVVGFLPVLKQITVTAITQMLDDKELLEQLKAEKFDVGIGELFDFAGFAVFEAIGLKNVVGAHSSSCMLEGTAFAIGLPVIPSFMPASLGVTDDTSSFSTRANNILFTFLSWYFQTTIAATAQSVMDEKLGNGVTPIWVSHSIYPAATVTSKRSWTRGAMAAGTLVVCCIEETGLLGRDTEGNRYAVISRCLGRCSRRPECPRSGLASCLRLFGIHRKNTYSTSSF